MHQNYIWRLIGLVCLAILLQMNPAFADKRVALIIGNANYKNTPPLTNPTNDASDVAQALTSVGFEVTLALDQDKRHMDQILAQFARASSKADASLFYYAGHGMQFQGRNYIMPVDANLEDEISLRYEMTAIDEVKAALDRSNGLRIMILDACRNNPLADRLVRSVTTTTRDIPTVKGYARPEKTRGMIVIYATQADEVANDGTGRNSPFSSAFLKEIKEPGLEIGTMFRRIGEDVYQSTRGQQSPELSISMVPEYYLNQAETDQTIWARIRVSDDASTIGEFLHRYPDSFYAPDAKARMELLEQKAREQAASKQLDQQKLEAAATDAARLKQEQTEREKIASEARAREQDLAVKLAAAETERQRIAAELAEKTKAQSDADKRQQLERAQADADRQQREANLRAEIERQKSTSSQLEKDRLLQDALAKDREKQSADEQALVERERVAKESAEKELQAQADRAEALKNKIAQLEQQAAAAQATVQAAERKAADAQKAASEQLEQQKAQAAAAEAARLSKDQVERERIAALARAREQELTAKLAAAETERQRMAAELSEKAKAQSAADQLQQSERAKIDAERQQREADLRAQIERQNPHSNQLEKDRLVQEALASDHDKQKADEQAAADRDRATKESADRESQAETERAQALKAEITRLGQEAAQARAEAALETEKAADAKKNAPAPDVKVALATPAQASVGALTPEQAALVAPIQAEMHRLGCSFDIGDWTSADAQRAVAKYARYAKLSSPPQTPDAAFLEA